MSGGWPTRILDRLTTVTFRERVVADDEVRYALNGTDPSVLTDEVKRLERAVTRREDRLP